MPFKDPDPSDPNMLVGVLLPADAEAMRDMAYVFAEEFARLGYSREQLLWLFKNPFYGGAHGAFQALGENETLSIIDECLNVWGNIRITVQDVQTVQTDQTPSSILPRVLRQAQDARTGDEGNRRSEPLKRFERSEAIERLERFEPARREERDDE
jgi:hypothetical protein